MQGNISPTFQNALDLESIGQTNLQGFKPFKSSSRIPKGEYSIVQPIKYTQHFPVVKNRQYKVIKQLDLKLSSTYKYQEIKRVLRNMKYIDKVRIEFNSQKNFEHLYSLLSGKVLAIEVEKLNSLPAKQASVFVKRLKDFKHITRLVLIDARPINDTKKEVNSFLRSLMSYRKLEVSSFRGDRNLPCLGKAMCNCFPYLGNLKKLEGPIDGRILQDNERFMKTVAKLENLQEFRLEIDESTLGDDILRNFRDWMLGLPLARKLTLVVTDAQLNADMSILNDVEVLEIVYELHHNVPALINNIKSLENLIMPVNFEWKVNPTDTHDHVAAEGFMLSLAKLKNIKRIAQTYSFDDETSVLENCYPIWKDIMSYYNFQMLETLNLGVFLNDSIVERFQSLFIENLRNLHRLRIFGLTLHNDGSSTKRFYLTAPILDLPKVIGSLPCLSEFEFNTEIEIQLNILTDFFRGLTQLKNLRRFKSEWLQISQNSFKAFAKRLFQMLSLEVLDIHLYSLYDIPKKELDIIFSSIGDSLHKMPNLKVLQITADNECFAQEDLWRQWQETLREKCGKKFIELTLAETE